jgi:membrane associated rhomboid family serine protease
MLELPEIVKQFNTFITNSKQHIHIILYSIGCIWLFNLVNWLTGSPLKVLGTIPRSKRGILGIFFSWLIHANFNHLFFNSIPLFCLSLLLISYNKLLFIDVSILIIFLEGFSVWLLARKANHMGASGLVAGYFGFLLILAYKLPSIVSVFLGAIVLYYFGGILLSFFPQQ